MPPSENKQHPQPPRSAPASGLPQWIAEAEDYLSGHGWQREGTNERGDSLWKDPEGVPGGAVVDGRVVEYPAEGGGMTKIVQKLVIPAPWTYAMQEAMQVQRQRDAAPVKK